MPDRISRSLLITLYRWRLLFNALSHNKTVLFSVRFLASSKLLSNFALTKFQNSLTSLLTLRRVNSCSVLGTSLLALEASQVFSKFVRSSISDCSCCIFAKFQDKKINDSPSSMDNPKKRRYLNILPKTFKKVTFV